MKNFWYVAQPNEILIDMDKPATSLPHVEMRLRGGVEARLLRIERIEMHRSYNEDHLHMLVTLQNEMSAMARATWALMFHSDIYRACSTFMRIRYGVPCPDLLITPILFDRVHNAMCLCDQKHTGPVMDICPAAVALRGDERTASFFGKPSRKNVPLFSTEMKKYDRNITYLESDIT
jgi:hypothetical protein